jgi:ribonuclease VapC
VNLFDASALFCFLQGEAGADVVERELIVGGACSAANWSETAQKLIAHRKDWDQVQALLMSYPLQVEPVLRSDAELAAQMWRRGSGLSLGDRICLATAQRLGATVWTADATWGSSKTVNQVR